VRKFSQYKLTESNHLVAQESTPTINFEQLKDLLLSTDHSRMEEYQSLIKGDCKFLDKKSEMIGNRVAFASFPRTGNSFLRKILEQVTGVFTGSDMIIKMTLPLQQ
jgi:hypothetical protein